MKVVEFSHTLATFDANKSLHAFGEQLWHWLSNWSPGFSVEKGPSMVEEVMEACRPEHSPASVPVRRTTARSEEGLWKTLLWLPVNLVQAVSLGIVCGTVIPVALVVQKCSGHSRFALWMARNIWAPIIIAGGLSRLAVSGQENVSPDRPALIVSNHQSYADVPILYRALPVPLRFTAKSELECLPFIGKFMRALGMVLIDRSTPQRAARAVRELGKVLQRGEWTVVFPEGTRSTDGVVGPFAAGSLAAAIAENVDILPVAIAGGGHMLSKGGFRVRPSKIQVRIGKPISTNGLKQSDRFELAAKARDAVERLLDGAVANSGASSVGSVS